MREYVLDLWRTANDLAFTSEGACVFLVSLAPVFIVVTQRSSPQTAAHIRTTSLSFCSLCANKITDIVSYVTNQSTGDCNQRFFRHSQVLQVPDYKKSEFLQWRKHQRDGCFICSTAVQKKRQKLYIWKKVLSIFRLSLFPVWMWTWAAIQRPASVLEMTYQVQKGLCSSWRAQTWIEGNLQGSWTSENEALIKRWGRQWRKPSFVPSCWNEHLNIIL